VLYAVFPEIFSEEPAEHGKEQHEEFPKIMGEFFSACPAMGWIGM
jgi:hypothetical protein